MEISRFNISLDIFKYVIHLGRISNSMCGKKLHLRALGYNKNVTKSALLNVAFVPEVPRGLSVQPINTSCLRLKWVLVESGKCKVDYILQYALKSPTIDKQRHRAPIIRTDNAVRLHDVGHRNKIIITKYPSAEICLQTTKGIPNEFSFRVKSRWGNSSSNFSEELVIMIFTNSAQHCLVNTTWMLIVGCLIVIVIVLVSVIVYLFVNGGTSGHCYGCCREQKVEVDDKNTLSYSGLAKLSG